VATIDMGQIAFWGEPGPHLTQCGQGRGLPSFILIHPTVWPPYTDVNVTDRQDRQTTAW